MSESILRKIFNQARDRKSYSKNLTLSGATRHSGATEGYIRTKNIHAVQKALGHSDIRTTMKYTHTDESEARIIIEPQAAVKEIKNGT